MHTVCSKRSSRPSYICIVFHYGLFLSLRYLAHKQWHAGAKVYHFGHPVFFLRYKMTRDFYIRRWRRKIKKGQHFPLEMVSRPSSKNNQNNVFFSLSFCRCIIVSRWNKEMRGGNLFESILIILKKRKIRVLVSITAKIRCLFYFHNIVCEWQVLVQIAMC